MLDELVTIAKFLGLGEAKLAQGKLVSAGVSAFVCDENMHAMNWHMGMALGGIRLQVPDSQVVRALEVLADFDPDDSEALEIREVASSNPRQITLWSSAIPLPEPPTQVSRRWKCLMCGYQWRDAE